MPLIRHWFWLPILSVIPVTAAFAAEGGKGPSEAIFIGEIVVLMLVGRLLGEAMVVLPLPPLLVVKSGDARQGAVQRGDEMCALIAK